MSRIAIIPLSERSHYLPVLALANSLRNAGHQVVFLGTVDFRQLVTERGFEFQTVFPELFPAGSSTTSLGGGTLLPRRALFAWRAGRARGRLQRALLRREWSGELSAPLARDFDLFLVDSFLAIVSIALARYGKPLLQFNVTLAAGANSSLPPTTQSAVPVPGLRGALINRLRWLWVALQRFFAALLSRLLGFHYTKETRQLAKNSGFPLKELAEASEYALRIRLPELILCHREFDFPHTPAPHRFYVGPCTDLGSSSSSGDSSSVITNAKPLIYCAFGSQLHRFPKAAHILQTIWETFREQSDFRLLLIAPESILLAGSSPQLQRMTQCDQPTVLSQAAVMVTHAGLGSVKECIRARVQWSRFLLEGINRGTRRAFNIIGWVSRSPPNSSPESGYSQRYVASLPTSRSPMPSPRNSAPF